MRLAEEVRTTKETNIQCKVNLDGSGQAAIATGIGFFDHMLTLLAFHSGFDITMQAKGDLEVCDHHTVEDCGIILGSCVKQALKDKRGIARYGSMNLPMDETLVLCAIDISGRPYFSFEGTFPTEKIGYMDTEMVREFFYAVSYSAGMNLHMKILSGSNNHHMIEGLFKAFGRALDEATMKDTRIKDIMSTKGSL